MIGALLVAKPSRDHLGNMFFFPETHFKPVGLIPIQTVRPHPPVGLGMRLKSQSNQIFVTLLCICWNTDLTSLDVCSDVYTAVPLWDLRIPWDPVHTMWPVHSVPAHAQTPGRGLSHEARALPTLQEWRPCTTDAGQSVVRSSSFNKLKL